MRTALDDLAGLLADGFEAEDIRIEGDAIRVALRRGKLGVTLLLARADAAELLTRFSLRAR